MSNHYFWSPSLWVGFSIPSTICAENNHDKNHWLDQLQEVHWKGCSLRTSLPTGARGGLKSNRQKFTQRDTNRTAPGEFSWANCFLSGIMNFFHQLSCFRVFFCKQHLSKGRGNFPPLLFCFLAGAHGADGRDNFAWPQRPVCCTPWGQHPGRSVSSSRHLVGHLVAGCGGNQMKIQTLKYCRIYGWCKDKLQKNGIWLGCF